MLPKLMNIGRLGCKHVRLLLPSGMRAYFAVITDVLGHLGIGATIETAEEGALIQAGPLHYMTAVSQHDARKSVALLELRSVLASLYGLQFRKERRLFVQRRGLEIRKLANAADVEAVFIERGYSVIYPLTLGLRDQMALFASASHVAGSLGAGLANSAFAPEGCDIFMIDPGLGDFYFWDLACLMRQRFTWYFAGEFRHYSLALATADFAVDTESLQSCLTTLQK
jgi:capsular polysaccharide biosynthesis protein